MKPFEALELLARIELVMKRYKKCDTAFSYGDIVLDTEKHTVEKCGVPVALSPKEFDVFVFFIRHQDIVISRERLLAAVWDYVFEGETRTVDTYFNQCAFLDAYFVGDDGMCDTNVSDLLEE